MSEERAPYLPEPVAPHQCSHLNKINLSCGAGTGPGLSYRYIVYLCRRCGTFLAYAEKNGVGQAMEFHLRTPEALEAAGQYLRWANASDVEETP